MQGLPPYGETNLARNSNADFTHTLLKKENRLQVLPTLRVVTAWYTFYYLVCKVITVRVVTVTTQIVTVGLRGKKIKR